MTGYLLDTNCISELVSVRPNAAVVAWINGVEESLLYLSVLTLGEIRWGVVGLPPETRRSRLEEWLVSELPQRFAGRILAVDAGVADHWGVIGQRLKRNGTPISTVDALLAATAQHHDLIVVTRNVRDFAKTGVRVFNPWENQGPTVV